MKKSTKKYRVNRKSVGLRLMTEKTSVILSNALSQKELKRLYEMGFDKLITITEDEPNNID